MAWSKYKFLHTKPPENASYFQWVSDQANCSPSWKNLIPKKRYMEDLEGSKVIALRGKENPNENQNNFPDSIAQAPAHSILGVKFLVGFSKK
jgi:hypothetical protein